MGFSSNSKTLNIQVDSIVYSIDLESKTGTREVIPPELMEMDKEEMEEERRLCYVGITRAKKSRKSANTDLGQFTTKCKIDGHSMAPEVLR